MTPLLVALGAGVGAPLRYWLGRRLDAGGRWPTGTLLANTGGSLLLGLLGGLAVTGHALALLGVGFCGALTTWSGLAVQGHALGRVRGGAYVVATVALALAACAVGFVAGAGAG